MTAKNPNNPNFTNPGEYSFSEESSESEVYSKSFIEAKRILKERFGADDLSNIELVHLSILVKHCIKEYHLGNAKTKELLEEIKKEKGEHGKVSDELLLRAQYVDLLRIDDPGREAAYRWLLDYNINVKTIPYFDLVLDETTGEVYRFMLPPEATQDHYLTPNSNENKFPEPDYVETIKEHDEKVKAKATELDKLGHKIEVQTTAVEPELKELLRRRRERSHLV